MATTRAALLGAVLLVAASGCGSTKAPSRAAPVPPPPLAHLERAPKGEWVVRDLGAVMTSFSGDGTVGWDYPLAINSRGEVVGTQEKGSRDRAFLWANGRLRDLGTLPGDTDSSAVAINDAGQVVGTSWKGSEETGHAFLWARGQMRDLGVGPEGDTSSATSINRRGQVAVTVHVKEPGAGMADYCGALWQQGRVGCLSPPYSNSVTINDRGQVIGNYVDDYSGFVWRRGNLVGLVGFAGTDGISATAINNHGVIVGDWQTDDGDIGGPFVWQAGAFHKIRLHPDPGNWEPVAINDRGQIAIDGNSVLAGGSEWVLWQRGAVRARGVGDPIALNDRGEIAISDDTEDAAIPAVWSRGSETRLPLLRRGDEGAALAINSSSQIVGVSGTFAPDDRSGLGGYLWTFHVVLWTRS